MFTHYGESSESLEGDRSRNRVQRCRLLTSVVLVWEFDSSLDLVKLITVNPIMLPFLLR